MMQQAVEHGADGGHIGEQFAPVIDGAVGGQQSAGALVAAHDDFEQVLGSGLRQLTHAEVVDDEQSDSSDRLHVLLARTVDSGLGQLFQQDVRLAIEHLVALQDGGLAAEIVSRQFLGDCVVLTLRLPDGTVVCADQRTPHDDAMPGQRVQIGWEANAVQVFAADNAEAAR